MIDVWVMAPNPERRYRIVRAVGDDNTIRVAGEAAAFPILKSRMVEASGDLAVIDWQPQADSTVTRDWLFEFLEFIPVIVLCSEPDSGIFNRILHSRSGGMVLQT